jgi:hypothetical protein
MNEQAARHLMKSLENRSSATPLPEAEVIWMQAQLELHMIPPAKSSALMWIDSFVGSLAGLALAAFGIWLTVL